MNARPPGDPAAMESLAASIVKIAGKLDGVDGSIVHALPAGAYAAHGRTRLNGSLRASAQKVSHAAERLKSLAAELSHGANVLRRDQSAWDASDRERRDRAAQEKALEARGSDAARHR